MEQKDKQFLNDLQNELLNQPNDGNADPVYWGVMETEECLVPEGYGDIYKALDSEGDLYSESEFKEYIEENYICCEENEKIVNDWKEVDKTSLPDMVDFLKDWYESDCEVVCTEFRDKLTRNTGCFLTKRACREYIDRFGYNHNKPQTYAMTAYRNFELEKLLDIIKKTDWSKI